MDMVELLQPVAVAVVVFILREVLILIILHPEVLDFDKAEQEVLLQAIKPEDLEVAQRLILLVHVICKVEPVVDTAEQVD